MSIVLGVAKYFKDHDITPKRNIKFIAFGGEEYGMRGAYYYESIHRYEDDVTIVIDLNQLGFSQIQPRLTLNVISNSDELNDTVSYITGLTDYIKETSDTADFRCIITSKWAPPSDYTPFYKIDKEGLKEYNTVCFVKDRGDNLTARWILHHRDGLNHTEGDVMKYFYTDDVNATGEMILNLVKYYAMKD